MSRAMVATVDPLTVACDDCRADVGAVCWGSAYGAMQTRSPHPSRAAKARCVLLDREARAESQWLELAAIWRDASEDDQRAILAVVKLRQAIPVGMDGLARVFGVGAVKHNGGQLGIAPGVTANDCADHLTAHAEMVQVWGAGQRDQETGELDALHAAARGVMVGQLVDSVQRGEVW
jgi:hypothetical protein